MKSVKLTIVLAILKFLKKNQKAPRGAFVKTSDLKSHLHFKIHGVPIVELSEEAVTGSPEEVHAPGKDQVISQLEFYPGMDCPVIIITPPLGKYSWFNPLLHKVGCYFKT